MDVLLTCMNLLLACTQAGGNADELQEKSKETKKKIVDTEEREQGVIKRRDGILMSMGNLVHDSVPISKDEVRGGEGREGMTECPSARMRSGRGGTAARHGGRANDTLATECGR